MVKPTSIATTLAVSVLSTLWLTVPAQAEDMKRATLLADACAVCHGTDGQGGGKIPKLSGELKADKFAQTMRGFASGEERATVMDRIAKGLTEQEITELASYFANLKK